MSFFNWQEKLLNKKIIVWGASIGGKQVHRLLTQNDLCIEAYCDNDNRKNSYIGKPVISPAVLQQMTENNDDYAIIIASYAFEIIYNQIESLRIGCEVYIYLLYDPCHLKSGQILFTDSEKQDIKSLYVRETYTTQLLDLILQKGFLNSDALGNIGEYIGFGGIEAYYYDDVVKMMPGVFTLLDVGSYTGDSILQMNEVFQNRIIKAFGFEPNKENLKEIKRKIVERKIDNLTLHEVALGDKNGYEYFEEKGPFFRKSGNQAGELIKTYRLDDFMFDVEENAILKIDIEGSEMNCLRGAENFIKKIKPYIAVCVYHREKDILKIPQYLRSLVPEYRFILRGGMHTVCYAFPEEK